MAIFQDDFRRWLTLLLNFYLKTLHKKVFRCRGTEGFCTVNERRAVGSQNKHVHFSQGTLPQAVNIDRPTLKKISAIHVIKLGFAPNSYPLGQPMLSS